MRAFVSAPTKSAKVSNIAIPEPKEGEILVKVSTVAQNPTDWVTTLTFFFFQSGVVETD